jgi:hypothetical protein
MPSEAPLKHRSWVPVSGRCTPSHIGEGHLVEIEPKASDKELTEALEGPSGAVSDSTQAWVEHQDGDSD